MENYKKYFTGLAKSTTIKYTSAIENLRKHYVGDLMNFDAINKSINTLIITDHNLKTLYYALLKITGDTRYNNLGHQIDSKIKNTLHTIPFDIYKLMKSLKEMPNTFDKLYFILFLGYPNVRLTDYHNLKFNRPYNKKLDNYYDINTGIITFNKLVKSNTVSSVIIQLTDEDQELFKKIISNQKNCQVSVVSFSSKMKRLNKKYFGMSGGVSMYRKLSYHKLIPNQDQRQVIKYLTGIAKKQNHSLDTAINNYF